MERLQAEEALEEAFHERQEINRIIELSPAVIFLWHNEEDWLVEYVSKNVNIFGYNPDEFYSGKIIHPNDLEVEPILNYNHDVSPYTSPLEYRIITKDGKIKWVIEYSTPRVNKEGKITHYYGLILDITERRKQEEFLIRDRTTFKIELIKKKGIETPLVCVSGSEMFDIKDQCLDVGAKAFILKDNLTEFAKTIENILKQCFG
ncbi:MAG: PAS domain-containing protein [Candidatus Heimdallarchaeota archaeon]